LTSSTDLYRILKCAATRPEPPSAPLSKRLEQSGVGTQQFGKTRSALDRGGDGQDLTHLVGSPDGLVEPQIEDQGDPS
jgi:hypothetical protein